MWRKTAFIILRENKSIHISFLIQTTTILTSLGRWHAFIAYSSFIGCLLATVFLPDVSTSDGGSYSPPICPHSQAFKGLAVNPTVCSPTHRRNASMQISVKKSNLDPLGFFLFIHPSIIASFLLWITAMRWRALTYFWRAWLIFSRRFWIRCPES